MKILHYKDVINRPLLSDRALLVTVAVIVAFGLVMLSSSTLAIADKQHGDPFYYLFRQTIYIALGCLFAFSALFIKTEFWRKSSGLLLVFGLVLLVCVLVPFIGKEVGGAVRWISVAGFQFQASELVKLIIVIYLASYMVRHQVTVRESYLGLLRILVVLGLVSVLLLLEPDYGATVVIFATAMAMMFIGGAKIWQCAVVAIGTGAIFAALIWTSSYRLERWASFLNPWADRYDSGFQLTQALIAFGRGEWFGVGLGAGMQKLFYLPEVHTDFIYSVLAEELGVAGAACVIALFLVLIWRAFSIARQANQCGKVYASYLSYGIGTLIGLQALVNIGVNTGVLPTKGLTLPLVSYGGSSIVVTLFMVGILLRVSYEVNLATAKKSVAVKKKPSRRREKS